MSEEDLKDRLPQLLQVVTFEVSLQHRAQTLPTQFHD